MITANEARKRSDTLATKCGEEEKKKVEARITEAVENGDSSCWIDFYVSDATKKWLESLGSERCLTREVETTQKSNGNNVRSLKWTANSTFSIEKVLFVIMKYLFYAI